MREKKIKSTKLDSFFLCRKVCKFSQAYYGKKDFKKNNCWYDCKQKNVSCLFHKDKNLHMKETNNHAMFFKRKHTTPYYKMYVIIYVMNIQGVINDHLWDRHTAEM